VRVLLAGARALLLVALVVLLAGPRLLLSDERVEQDWVLLLADRSQSMTIADGPEGSTREASLRGLLAQAGPELERIAAERRLLVMGFDGSIRELETEGGSVSLGEASGPRTLLGRALDAALDRAAARPVAGVVVLSDGASSDEISRRAAQRLRAERIPVFAVPIGSDRPVGDLALEAVEAPSAGFVGDRLPVRVQVGASGPSAGAWVELVEASTGLVLDRRRIEAGGDGAGGDGGGDGKVTLLAEPGQAGESLWRVRLLPDGLDLLPDNNDAEFLVNLVDRPLRVLHVDGYPRWEFRYVRNLLVREPSLSSGSLVLSTGRRHTQEGDAALDRLPVSPGEWEQFDVVVLGDLRAELLSEEQLEQLRDHVAERGAGLLWIAGPGATPESWRGTPVESLLPITSLESVADYSEPVTMSRAPDAERLGLLELADEEAGGWPQRLSDPATGWSLLRWAQRLEPAQLKPTASVLATLAGVSGGAPTPGVVTMRFGAGRVVYVATDEIWRWRYARGEELPERFWIPLIRLLGRDALARVGKSAVLRVEPGRVQSGAAVSVEIELLDERLIEAGPGSLRSRVLDGQGRTLAEIQLRPEAGAGRSRRYSSAWVAPGPGTYSIESDDPALLGDRLQARLTVLAENDERQQPETNFQLLETLTGLSGGKMLTGEELAGLNELLPNRQRRVLSTPQIETLWDTPLTLLVITLLLSVEWIGRRVLRLT
jgi:hypothetical protein